MGLSPKFSAVPHRCLPRVKGLGSRKAIVGMPSQGHAALKMAVHMAEPAIKRVKSFLTCCAKLGALSPVHQL